jgi:hypothetical protein
MVGLLFESWSAFTNYKFTLTDYGKYVNMLWNTAHGRPFRVLTEDSYLQTHLSFTLAPLGLIFYVWDHPFALAVAQWIIIGSGAVVLVWTARRAGWGPPECAALAIFTLLHPYTQSVILSEFHGVALFYLLVPWLLHELLFRRSRVWLPVVLLLGIREEAAFVVLPLLLYVAVTERWRAGYGWALFALVYGILATTWLFQAVSGLALSTRRDRLAPSIIVRSLLEHPLRERLVAAFWLVLPIVPYLRRDWRPLLVIPSVAAAVVLLSPFREQHTLSSHYPAETMSLTAAALVVAVRSAPRPAPAAAVALAGLTLVAHVAIGFLPGGGRGDLAYRQPRPTGVAALRAARRLRQDGLLVTSEDLAVFAANRADLLPWRRYDPARHRPDLLFFALPELEGPRQGPFLARALRQGEVGVDYFDGWFAIARRGAPPTGNAAVLAAEAARPRTILFAFSRRQAGTEVLVDGGFIARYWRGDARRAPLIALASVPLAAGPHRAVLRYRTDGGAPGRGSFGTLRLFREGAAESLAELALPPTVGIEYRNVVARFELRTASRIEARVVGGAGAVWLDRLVFEPDL